MHNSFQPLKFQMPVFEKDRPVFPDSPMRTTPYILRNIRNWKWEVEIQVLTLQYLMGGHIVYEIDGKTIETAKGACFLFMPGQKLAGRSVDGKPVTMFAAHFAKVPQLPSIRKLIYAPIREVTLFEETAEYAVKCRQENRANSDAYTETALRQLFHLFELNLSIGTVSAVQLKVEELVEQIKREPSRDWRIEVMCEQTALSRSQLTRWFNRITGCPPNRYVIEHRIARAIQMLGMTDLPISEIAESLGYRDVPFFIRQFRQETGMPPGSLRK